MVRLDGSPIDATPQWPAWMTSLDATPQCPAWMAHLYVPSSCSVWMPAVDDPTQTPRFDDSSGAWCGQQGGQGVERGPSLSASNTIL
ncbi:hypothetical protein E2C01_092018 [Portunus trituberculatus]|uniref:Uncharacterized protein n=1 Tax=Portunus trituberculatus TaxID=210409 RepID=A0A5B7JKH5_PORTR|nr:hypothetical protein [Portunus trituberculatus]